MPHFQELKIKIVLLKLQIQQLRVCILDKQEIKIIPIYSKFRKITNNKAIKTIKTMKLVSFWMITFNKINKLCLFWIIHYTKKTVKNKLYLSLEINMKKNKMLKTKSKMLFSFCKVIRIEIIIQFSFSIQKQPKIKMQFSFLKKPPKFNQTHPSKALQQIQNSSLNKKN